MPVDLAADAGLFAGDEGVTELDFLVLFLGSNGKAFRLAEAGSCCESEVIN